jgi:hypothetical protein
MKILDFEFDLPGEFRVEKTSFSDESSRIDIVGKNAGRLSAAFVEQAVAAGFSESRQEADSVDLERGEQTLLLWHDSERLTIHMRDPTILPRARVDGSAVLLGDLRFDVGATSIAPLRERRHYGWGSPQACLQGYPKDKQTRTGAWRLSGVSAPKVVERVLDSAVASKGLTRGGVFGPPKGGMEVWRGEAYSKVELVKVDATVEPGLVLLEIDLVENRGRIGREPSKP